MSATTTPRAPSAAKRRASAAPMPDAPPVTTMHLPSHFIDRRSLVGDSEHLGTSAGRERGRHLAGAVRVDEGGGGRARSREPRRVRAGGERRVDRAPGVGGAGETTVLVQAVLGGGSQGVGVAGRERGDEQCRSS